MAHIPPAGLEKAAPADIRSSNYEGDQELKLQDRKTKQANYIRWDDPCVETIPEGEAAKIKAVSDQFNRFQAKNFDEHHHCFRGTHLKTQGVVHGKLKIKDNLPEHLAQGMFKKPNTHDFIMRYSSLTPKLLPDTAAAPRGCAIKIFGVEGPKLWQNPDHESPSDTQDWTFNNYPILELRTPKDTHEIADSLERNWSDGDKFVEEVKARPDADVATRGALLPQEHMAAMTEWSQSAYRYGDYVAKLALFPVGEEQINLKKWRIKESDPPNILSTTLRDFHKNHKAVYSLRVQLLQNIEEQSVEDIGFEWDEEKYPFEEVATLECDPQESWSPEFRVYFDDRITCNSWHGLVEHQPLGSTNRMRRTVYAESRKLRLKMNGFKDYYEPQSLKEVPIPA